jgi:hypothetical protein
MEMLHSPSDIEVILHYNVSSLPHPRFDAAAVHEAVVKFISAGLMTINQSSGSGYAVTQRGQAFVHMLCSTPYPESAWVHPITNEIVLKELTI